MKSVVQMVSSTGLSSVMAAFISSIYLNVRLSGYKAFCGQHQPTSFTWEHQWTREIDNPNVWVIGSIAKAQLFLPPWK